MATIFSSVRVPSSGSPVSRYLANLGCQRAGKIGNVYEYAAGQWALKGEWDTIRAVLKLGASLPGYELTPAHRRVIHIQDDDTTGAPEVPTATGAQGCRMGPLGPRCPHGRQGTWGPRVLAGPGPPNPKS